MNLLATHKECTLTQGDVLYCKHNNSVYKFNFGRWLELDIKCSADDFLKTLQRIEDEPVHRKHKTESFYTKYEGKYKGD